MSHKVTAYVADGSLVCQHPDVEVDKMLGRSLTWIANDDREEAGSFFQQSYTANITTKESGELRASGIENIYLK